MAQEFNIGQMKAEAIAKAFGVDIEKGRHGVYADNAENRRLNRVGQEYGHKAEEKQTVDRSGAKGKEVSSNVADLKSKVAAAENKWMEIYKKSPYGSVKAQEAFMKYVKLKEQLEQVEKTEQEKKTSAASMESAAQGASDEALKRAAADPKAAPEVKQAAEKELKERGGEEENKGKKIITISDYEDEEIEEMSDPAFLKMFGKQVNDFLKKLDDDAISKIGYLKRADGSSTKTPVNRYNIDGSDDTIQVECWKAGGKYCCSIIFGKDLDYSHGARKIIWDSGKKFSTPEEAVEDLHKKISAIKDGEKLEFENW